MFLRLLLLAAALLLPAVPAAQESLPGSIRFDRFGLEDGLSQSSIQQIRQDETGFLWLATEDGLNRYDGYEFRVFRSSPNDPYALAHNFVSALELDRQGRLWVGSRWGVQIYDAALERFTTPAALPGSGSGRRPEDVTALAEGPDGAMWLGTQEGQLWRVGPADARQIELTPDPGTVHGLTVDRHGALWVAGGRGVLRLDGTGRETSPPQLSGIMGPVFHVLAARSGAIWLATADGVLRLPEDADAPVERQLSGRAVRWLLEDSRGSLWAASERGLAELKSGSADWILHEHDSNDPFSLSGDILETLYEDATGVLWIGTSGSGLTRYSPHGSRFRHLGLRTDPNSGLSNPLVWAIHEDSRGRLWIGTKGGGLNRLDPSTGRFRYYQPDPEDPGSLSSDWILAIHEDSAGRLWIGTRGGGLNRLDREADRFIHYRHRPDRASGLPNDRVYVIEESDEGSLWLGTNDGVARLDPEQDRIRLVDHRAEEAGTLRDASVRALHFGRDGRLWIGTRRGGLHWLDTETGRYHAVLEPLADFLIMCLYEDTDGVLWAATDRGLLRVETEGLSYRIYRKADGLPNDLIYAVVPGDDGRLWLSTNRGLSRFDTDAGRFVNFDTHDGLISNEFNQGAYLVTADGTLLFGSIKGVTLFQPGMLETDLTPPRAIITDLRISNRSVSHRGVDASSPLDRHISQAQEVSLPHSSTFLSLDFTALHFAAPRSNRFAYRLLGLSDEWIETDAGRRTATFTQLPPGEYRFQLRAANGDGVWQGVPTELAIRIEPPFWRTGWAYAGYLLAAALLMGLVLRGRLSKIREQERAQAIIASSEERLRLALWGSGDELWDWDLASGEVHRMNVHAALDRPAEERCRSVEGILRSIHDEDREAVRGALVDHLEGRRSLYQSTYRCRNRSGGWTWVLDRGQIVSLDRNGEPARLSGTTKVIDELKQTEQALKQLNDELEQRVSDRTRALEQAYDELSTTQAQLVESEKMASLGNLVAGVAHELNTPIGIGLTAASHLKGRADRIMDAAEDPGVDEQLRDYCRHSAESAALITSSLERAAKMVKSFKQVAVDQVVEERRAFQLRQYLEQILISLRPRLRRSSVEVEIECSEELTLESYPGAFYQILSNLILNSVVHGFTSGAPGRISIGADWEEDGTLRLRYRDTGSGMEEEVRQKIFEPFFTTRRGRGGTGLGLHIVYNIVTQVLGGTIVCRSAPGEGVEFELRLPVSAPAPENDDSIETTSR